ncbi:MAG TPA: MFS transporter [Bacteroidota bacterium]|nr:MFS transporter [Bacteroidota bacterium]
MISGDALSAHPDVRLLFAARTVRLFAYGFLSVILALYLASVGLDEREIGLLFTFTLLGDAVVSLWMTTSADRISRRKMLLLGAALMTAAGLVFALTSNIVLLGAAAIIGVISPSGKEIGPFLSIEQAALSQLTPGHRRTTVFGWYNLAGSAGTAIGALAAGGVSAVLSGFHLSSDTVYRVLVFAYGGCGLLLAVFFMGLSPAVEARPAQPGPPRGLFFGLHRSRRVVMKMSALYGLDAFGGGFIVQSLIAYWFYIRFGTGVETLGGIFFGANLIAAVSALFAARIARKIGLVNTMVVTHLPSNVLLILVPLMPTLPLAAGVLLLRFTISQMDVPTRQSYTMAVVDEDERSAASGVTTIARSVGASLSPALAGLLMASPALLGFPFFIAGGVKIVYDLLLYNGFRKLKPAEELDGP